MKRFDNDGNENQREGPAIENASIIERARGDSMSEKSKGFFTPRNMVVLVMFRGPRFEIPGFMAHQITEK